MADSATDLFVSIWLADDQPEEFLLDRLRLFAAGEALAVFSDRLLEREQSPEVDVTMFGLVTYKLSNRMATVLFEAFRPRFCVAGFYFHDAPASASRRQLRGIEVRITP